MNYEFIKVENTGPVTRLTLNRPQVLNAIHRPMHHELQSALDAFAAAKDQYVCVITGAGDRAFCAGSDLKAAAAAGAISGGYPSNGYAGLIERFDLSKPVIAAVNGIAFGGGFEIALACDLIIASDNARFALPEPLVGAVALGGGLHRLPRQVGLKHAMGMILTGRQVDAHEAVRLGFVNEVVAKTEFMEAVDRWCRAIVSCAPLSVRASKQTVMRGLDEPSLEAAIRNQEAYPAFAMWRSAKDTIEGPRAFAEKRPLVWRGE
jgi:enoyl-CoA hydratase/carnithine racemase